VKRKCQTKTGTLINGEGEASRIWKEREGERNKRKKNVQETERIYYTSEQNNDGRGDIGNGEKGKYKAWKP